MLQTTSSLSMQCVILTCVIKGKALLKKKLHNSLIGTNKVHYLKFDKILVAFRIGFQSVRNESFSKAPWSCIKRIIQNDFN